MGKKTSGAAKTAKPRKAGRPPLDPSNVRNKEIVIPVSSRELQEAKEKAGRLPLATWARSKLLD